MRLAVFSPTIAFLSQCFKQHHLSDAMILKLKPFFEIISNIKNLEHSCNTFTPRKPLSIYYTDAVIPLALEAILLGAGYLMKYEKHFGDIESPRCN